MGRNKDKMMKIKNKFGCCKILDINEDKVAEIYNIVIICIPPGIELDLSSLQNDTVIIDMRYGLSEKEKEDVQRFINHYNGYNILYRQATYQNRIWCKTECSFEDYERFMNIFLKDKDLYFYFFTPN